MNDYLNLPKHERELFSGKEPPPLKTEVNEASNPPLPLGVESYNYVKPVAHCDNCGWASGDLSHHAIAELLAFGCRECKKGIRIVDLWE